MKAKPERDVKNIKHEADLGKVSFADNLAVLVIINMIVSRATDADGHVRADAVSHEYHQARMHSDLDPVRRGIAVQTFLIIGKRGSGVGISQRHVREHTYPGTFVQRRIGPVENLSLDCSRIGLNVFQ